MARHEGERKKRPCLKVAATGTVLSLALGAGSVYASENNIGPAPAIQLGNIIRGKGGTSGTPANNDVEFGLSASPTPNAKTSSKSPSPKAKESQKPSPSATQSASRKPSPSATRKASPSQPPNPTHSASTQPKQDPKPTHETDPQQCIASLPLEVRAGQVVVMGISADRMGGAASVYNKEHLGGLTVMTAASGNQIANFQNEQQIPALVSSDVEGGEVDRYQGLSPMVSEQTASHMGKTAAKMMVANRASQLHDVGIDQVYGPVVDIDHGNNALGSRLFSSDTDTVSKYSAAYAEAWLGGGIIPTAKHWPGGVGTINTDNGSSKISPLSELGADMSVYESLPQGTAIMVSNSIVPGLTHGNPASISRDAITGELRGHQGFNGPEDLVVTDALNAPSVTQGDMTVAKAAEEAIDAGADEALFVAGDGSLADQAHKVTKRIVNAVRAGRINEDQLNTSVARVLYSKHVNPCEIDIN